MLEPENGSVADHSDDGGDGLLESATTEDTEEAGARATHGRTWPMNEESMRRENIND